MASLHTFDAVSVASMYAFHAVATIAADAADIGRILSSRITCSLFGFSERM
jgi:hypothetical protein